MPKEKEVIAQVLDEVLQRCEKNECFYTMYGFGADDALMAVKAIIKVVKTKYAGEKFIEQFKNNQLASQ